jgi:hypothetical protein
MRAKLAALVLITAVALVGTVAWFPSGLTFAASDSQHLEGSWIVNVTPSGPDAPPPFVNLGAFTRDGSVVGVDSFGGGSVGEWTRIGHAQFGVTFVGLFSENGQFFRFKVRSNITLNQKANEFTGPFLTEVTDSEGNLLFSFQGTVQASRIGVEPL